MGLFLQTSSLPGSGGGRVEEEREGEPSFRSSLGAVFRHVGWRWGGDEPVNEITYGFHFSKKLLFIFTCYRALKKKRFMILIGKQNAGEGENGERQISLLRCPQCPGLDQGQSKEPGTPPGSHAQMPGVQRRPSSRASPGTLADSWIRTGSRSKTGDSVSDTSITGDP